MEAFVGQIRMFAGNFAPDGWSVCDGSSLPITGNETLYTLIGTTYGGDGRTNFNLPDLRGKLPLHIGKGPQTVTNYAIGQKVGADTVTINEANLPTHSHTLNATTVAANQTAPVGLPLLGTAAHNFYELNTAVGFSTVALNTAALQSAPGGGSPHDNSMPTMPLNYIICLVGLYPDFQ